MKSGRSILTTLEKGWGFQGFEALPTFWPFKVNLGTVMVSLGMTFSIS